jgi:hypothetical protein
LAVEIEVMKRNLDAGDGKREDVVKIRLWDKPKNLELLSKHLGIIKQCVEVEADRVSGGPGSPVLGRDVESETASSLVSP